VKELELLESTQLPPEVFCDTATVLPLVPLEMSPVIVLTFKVLALTLLRARVLVPDADPERISPPMTNLVPLLLAWLLIVPEPYITSGALMVMVLLAGLFVRIWMVQPADMSSAFPFVVPIVKLPALVPKVIPLMLRPESMRIGFPDVPMVPTAESNVAVPVPAVPVVAPAAVRDAQLAALDQSAPVELVLVQVPFWAWAPVAKASSAATVRRRKRLMADGWWLMALTRAAERAKTDRTDEMEGSDVIQLGIKAREWGGG